MDLRQEIEQLSAVGFSQKETVEMLIAKGFTKEEIASLIFEYYERAEKKSRLPFVLSVIGQVLITAYFGIGLAIITENLLVLLLAAAFILLTIGFFQGNRNCTIAWIVIFLIALVFFVFVIMAKGGYFFPGVLLSSMFARYTYTVLDDRKIQEEQYTFD